MSDTLNDVIGIGNAIVDVLAHTDDDGLARCGATKGTMMLIDGPRAAELYRQMPSPVECSGGSAANTMVGVASLGGRSAYIGKVRDDQLGQVFSEDIRAAGVAFDTEPSSLGLTTGRCLIWVTPDAQRTMQTYLGASSTLSPADIDPAAIVDARIVYLEGYLWDPPPAKQAFLKAADIAHGAGRKVALSLSDPFCVERHRSELRDFVSGHVDLLFANESEIVSLYEASEFQEAVRQVRDDCEVAALTRGEHGSLVATPDQVIEVAAEVVPSVVDTTGAGDLFASGFLFGLAGGKDMATCARLGSIAAAEIISHFGARPERPLDGLVPDRLSE